MLVFHSHCQMANQLFMYAAACSLAKKGETSYCLSEIGFLKYFKLAPTDKFNAVKYAWYRITNRLKPKYSYHHYQDNFIDYSKLMLNNTENSWYYGYFQGEKYFYGNAAEIKKRFAIKHTYQKEFTKYASEINLNKKIVAVHIRRSDYNDFDLKELNGPNLCLPNSYYRKILEPYIGNTAYQIIFLSDDIIAVKKEFSEIENVIFSENSSITDFQILMHADVLILANSSFSWWGAWLNEKINKKVYVPKYFLGFKVKKEYPVTIIPYNWEQVEVYE